MGFVNLLVGAIHTYNTDFDRMITSNDKLVRINLLYIWYIPEQDVFSASWLFNHKVETAGVFADFLSGTHALLSYCLVPTMLSLPISNTMNTTQGSFVYLGSLNIVDGVMTTYPTGSFNTSEISYLFDQANLVYSNGNSEILFDASPN